ncbi:hypothetical protein [Streptomyces noursei]|uniref:hypothetical protein n=1 Tax=Streptomyces noursei TaxID=1971 RepID=UPI0013966F13
MKALTAQVGAANSAIAALAKALASSGGITQEQVQAAAKAGAEAALTELGHLLDGTKRAPSTGGHEHAYPLVRLGDVGYAAGQHDTNATGTRRQSLQGRRPLW